MESAYLKATVGPVLAKGIAETIVAQPANPQEYLALYLLHHLQEEERREDLAAQRRRADAMRAEWAAARAQEEKSASDVIKRGFTKFREGFLARRAAEAALAAAYTEAEEEAEELLEQVPPAVADDDRGGDNDNNNNNDASAAAGPSLEQLAEALEESRAEFFKSQRFMLSLQKADLGALKTGLLEHQDRVRAGVDEAAAWTERVAAAERAEEEAALDPTRAPPRLSALAAELAQRLEAERDHTRLVMPLATYRVLRCLCYLLYNSTPRATESAAQVAAVLKPTVTVQLLRAFNPVGSYAKGKPLRLEEALPQGEGEGEGAGAGGGAEEEDAGPLVSQPRGRQVRRVLRVMRVMAQDMEYFDTLDPEESLGDDADDILAEQPALQQQSERAKAAVARRDAVRGFVESECRARGGVALYALQRFLRAAVAYRTARDAWVNARREQGLGVPDGAGFEAPEAEEDDALNEEALVDEDGAPDVEAVRALLARVGEDSDEALAKLWEKKDERARRELRAVCEAMARREEEAEEEDQ